jgi:alkylhydroperoxidase family enzyme
MTRLPEPDLSAVPEDVRQLLSALPDRPLFRQLARAETAIVAWIGLGGALLNLLELAPALRELVILQVCASTGSEYERVHHAQIAAASGVSGEQIDAIAAGELDSPALETVAPLLAAIDRLVCTHRIDQADFETLLGQLGARQTVEVLLVVGFYLGHALFTAAIDLDLEPAAGLATQASVKPQQE